MTHHQSGVAALQKVALVNVDLNVWSGYKRTTELELISVGAALPKGSPLTNGGKKIFPTEFLAEFSQIRKEISRKLASYGVAALGGSARAVPETIIDEVNDYLEAARDRFIVAKADFERNYDSRISDYLQSIADPKVRDIIERAKLERDDAVGKFGMKWQVFKIVPAGDEEQSSKSLVDGMASSLFEEVAKSAKDIYLKSFHGKSRVTQKSLNQVRMLRNKMEGLKFLDEANIEPIIKSIDETLSSLPKDGWLDKLHLALLTGVIKQLSDPELMLEHAKLIAAGQNTVDALGIKDNDDKAVIKDIFSDMITTPGSPVQVNVKVVELSEDVNETSPNLPLIDVADLDYVEPQDSDDFTDVKSVQTVKPIPESPVATFF